MLRHKLHSGTSKTKQLVPKKIFMIFFLRSLLSSSFYYENMIKHSFKILFNHMSKILPATCSIVNSLVADQKCGQRCSSYLIEWFSFECRKVIGFAFTTLRGWRKKLAPLFHPVRSKTKTNRDSLARVFPRFASATCNYFVF